MTVRAEAQIDLARVDDGAAGQNGATFTPSVDAAGDISWTNDGGLPNPQTQNIMGPQGDPGTPGTNGVSVTAVEPQYYLSTSDSSAAGGSWSSTPATFVSGCYYWTRDYITFSDGTHDTSTEVYNAGMTQAAQDAYDALTLADDTNQYFWYAPTGADTGAHITEVPQDEWNDSSDPNYHSGGNLLARTNGLAVRDGMTELATFGASGTVVGQNANGKSRTEIGTAGMQIVQNVSGTDRAIANLGYGPGIDSGGGTSNAPYYTFGTRAGNIGNYSVAEGAGPTASGYASHAEGSNATATKTGAHAEGEGTTASADYAHAEGKDSTASGKGAHAEGIQNNVASGDGSHSEGGATSAAGIYSHAGGFGTIANKKSQTVIGEYNEPEYGSGTVRGTYAFIIGNGTSSGAASNALTVSWSGNVVADGGLTLYNNKAVADFVVEKGTDSGWAYQKWYSGRVDAIYNGSITYSATSSSGQLYRSVSNTLAIPSGIFSATPQFVTIGINLNSTVVIGAVGLATSTTNIGFQVWRSTNTNTSTSTTATVRATYVP